MSITTEDLHSSEALTISIATAAAAIGVDPRTVSAGVRAGTIPSVRLGRRVLIPREKFLALFQTTPENK